MNEENLYSLEHYILLLTDNKKPIASTKLAKAISNMIDERVREETKELRRDLERQIDRLENAIAELEFD